MITIKILGTGCANCKRMLNDVTKMVARNDWQVNVEYITEITEIMAFGVMGLPALVVNEKVLIVGYPSAAKIEQTIRQQISE